MTRNNFHNFVTNNSKDAICIWWFNVDLDVDWDQQKSGFFPRVETSDKTAIFGMEQIMLMLASENDFVIMRHHPNELICNNIKETGNRLPNILTPFIDNINQRSTSELILSDKKLITVLKSIAQKSKTYLMPYAITKYEIKIAELIGAELVGPPYELASWINSKITARNISQELNFATTFGMECHSKEDLFIASNMIQNKYPNSIMVLKDEYGASGKGLFFIKNKQDWDLVIYRAGKIENNYLKFNTILEKWHSVKENINYQLIITDNTYLLKNYLFNLSKQDVKNGIYKGSIFIEKTSKIYESYKSYAILLGDYLYNKGYRGICNVDSIILEDDLIIPIIEINGRLSLSTYISCISDMFFHNMSIASAYYDINSKIELSEITNFINKYKYNRKSETGIFIYSFSIGINRSRLFCLFIYPDINNIHKIKLEFENILENINLKYI